MIRQDRLDLTSLFSILSQGARAKARAQALMKRPVYIIIANFLIILVLVLVAEMVLRSFFPIYTVGDSAIFEYDNESAFVLKRNIHTFKTTDYQSETVTNDLGTANFQEVFERTRPLIFAVGDSFTKGSGVPADASYPFQLDLLINSQPIYEPKFDVVNLGVPGYSGRQNILRLEHYTERIGVPDYVLYMGSDNDSREDMLLERGMRHSHFIDGNPKWGVLVGPLQWLTNDFQIGLRIKLGIRKLRDKFANLAVANAAIDSGPSVAQLQTDNLQELAEFAKNSDTHLIVTWSTLGDSYNWLKIWADRTSVGFADWRSHVDAVRKVKSRLPMANNHQAGHNRTWVNGMIARAFALEIERQEETRRPVR